MALTISLSIASILADRSQSTVEDNTVWGTDGNPARADVGVFLKMYKVDQTSVRTALTTTPDNADAEVTAEWTFDLTVDGHYQGDYIVVPDYNGATAYVQYDVSYSGGVVYRALQATTGNAPPNATYWEVVSDPTTLVANDGTATESANATVYVFNDILTPNTEYKFGNIAEDVALEFGTTSSREEDVETYEMVAVLLDGMWIASTRQEYSNGEKIARKMDSIEV